MRSLLKVPVYFEGPQESPSFVLVESSAIVMYLLEKYDKNHVLLPKYDEISQQNHARAKMWQFFSFASSELYPFIAKSWEIMYKPGQTPEQMQKELAQLGEVRLFFFFELIFNELIWILLISVLRNGRMNILYFSSANLVINRTCWVITFQRLI